MQFTTLSFVGILMLGTGCAANPSMHAQMADEQTHAQDLRSECTTDKAEVAASAFWQASVDTIQALSATGSWSYQKLHSMEARALVCYKNIQNSDLSKSGDYQTLFAQCWEDSK
jgi:hypothetical protein